VKYSIVTLAITFGITLSGCAPDTTTTTQRTNVKHTLARDTNAKTRITTIEEGRLKNDLVEIILATQDANAADERAQHDNNSINPDSDYEIGQWNKENDALQRAEQEQSKSVVAFADVLKQYRQALGKEAVQQAAEDVATWTGAFMAYVNHKTKATNANIRVMQGDRGAWQSSRDEQTLASQSDSDMSDALAKVHSDLDDLKDQLNNAIDASKARL